MVINVKTGKTIGNGLQLFNCKKVAWSEDSEGFFVYVNIYFSFIHIILDSNPQWLIIIIDHCFSFQYDPEGRDKRNLFYHYVNEYMQDKLIAKIRKAEAHTVSFKVSNDNNYLILSDSRTLSIANIKSLAGEIRFDLIFKMSRDIKYVSEIIIETGINEIVTEFYFSIRNTLGMIVNFSLFSQTLEHQTIILFKSTFEVKNLGITGMSLFR